MEQRIAFVTGATGLLGNNLVRLLLDRGWTVKALARSQEKASKQFEGLEVEVIQGDMTNVQQFASTMRGVTAVFHTAAYFRESFLGGSHWKALHAANVLGTRNLLEAA